jgi:hypothetical protein
MMYISLRDPVTAFDQASRHPPDSKASKTCIRAVGRLLSICGEFAGQLRASRCDRKCTLSFLFMPPVHELLAQAEALDSYSSAITPHLTGKKQLNDGVG